MLRKSLFWWLTSFLAIVLLATVGRSLLDSLLVRWDESAAVHRDRSQFATGVSSQVSPNVVIVFRNEDGRRTRVLADAAEYSAFVRATFERLEAARDATSAAVEQAVAEEFMPLEAAAHERVPVYADWYFAWTTTYRLLCEAAKSTLQHALEPRVLSLQASVAADVGAYIRRHYEEDVLEPEISDALLRQAFARAHHRAHGEYLSAIAELDHSFQRFVAEKTTHLEGDPGDIAATIVVDWDSQFRKLKLSHHEKGGVGTVAGATGVAALAVIGAKSSALPAAAKAAFGGASKASSALLARLSTRLAAPVASKAVATATSAGTGVATGTAVGGPFGGAVGALTGIGFDLAVTKTVELVERPEFEADVHRAVAATYGEWREAVERSLQHAVGIWFGDTIQLLKSFDELQPATPDRGIGGIG